MSARKLVFAVALGMCLAAGIWAAFNLAPEPPALVSATVLPAAGEIPEFDLINQAGAPVDERFFRGQWDLVFFGFTNCPDVCPITLNILSAARRELAANGSDQLPRIVLVSVDPERDTPDALSAYVSSFGEGTAGITGEIEQIRRLTDGLGIFFQKRDSTDDGYYAVDHSSAVLVIDPDGRFHALFSSPHRVENFVNDLPILSSS